MATEASQPLKASYEASADISALQYTFVKLDGNGRLAAVTAATDRVVGVLQNKPKGLGQMGEVVIIGITKVVSVGVIAIGANVAPDANGKAQSATLQGYGGAYVQGTKQVVGHLKQATAAAANDVVSVVVNCVTPVPAT